MFSYETNWNAKYMDIDISIYKKIHNNLTINQT